MVAHIYVENNGYTETLWYNGEIFFVSPLASAGRDAFDLVELINKGLHAKDYNQLSQYFYERSVDSVEIGCYSYNRTI